MDDIDQFFEDYENEMNSPKLKMFVEFIADLNYEGSNFNLDSLEIKRKKPLRANKWIPPSNNSLF